MISREGWGIPCHFGKQHAYGSNYIKVGDAAGLANPLYKEGVGTSMMSGIIAAQKAREVLASKNFSDHAFSDYPKLLRNEFGKQLFTAKWPLKQHIIKPY